METHVTEIRSQRLSCRNRVLHDRIISLSKVLSSLKSLRETVRVHPRQTQPEQAPFPEPLAFLPRSQLLWLAKVVYSSMKTFSNHQSRARGMKVLLQVY